MALPSISPRTAIAGWLVLAGSFAAFAAFAWRGQIEGAAWGWMLFASLLVSGLAGIWAGLSLQGRLAAAAAAGAGAALAQLPVMLRLVAYATTFDCPPDLCREYGPGLVVLVWGLVSGVAVVGATVLAVLLLAARAPANRRD